MLCCIPLFESGREYIPSFRVETQSSYAYRSLSESLLAYLITFSTPRNYTGRYSRSWIAFSMVSEGGKEFFKFDRSLMERGVEDGSR